MSDASPTRGPRLVSRGALPALVPALATIALAAVLWRGSPADFVPLWSDEIVYWNETAAFMRAGFDGGYITVAETPARAAFSHFGPHGAGYAVFYGSLARLIGWKAASPYFVHLAFVTLCAAVWFWRRRGRPGRLAETLVVATFWPLLLYLPTAMTEPLHFGIGLLFASLLDTHAPSRRNRIARLLLLGVAVVLRPTWAFVLPALVRDQLTSWRRWAAVAAIMTALAIGSFSFQSWTAAPYGLTWLLQSLTVSPESAWLVLRRAWSGLLIFTSPHEQWFITLYRAQTAVGLVVLAVLWWRGRGADRARCELAALVLLPVLAAQLALYDVESGRDLRIVTVHGLVALLLVVSTSRLRAALAAAAGVALLPTLLTTYTSLHDGRFMRAGEARDFSDAVRGALSFDEAATSPWDNTLLVHADALAPAILGTPPGIGVSYVLDWEDLPSPPRSRYVLLRSRDEAAYRPEGLQPLVQLRDGTIYRRIDVASARSEAPAP